MSDFGFCIVTEEEARQVPYPYVYIEKDGTYSELNDGGKMYLEAKFHPADGGRPYVKTTYEQRTADDNISGFLERKLMPKNVKEKVQD